MKRYVALFTVMIILCLSACSQEIATDKQKIIDSGKYYSVYGVSANKFYYEGYDDNGNTVISDTTDGPITISMITDDIVDIDIGMGTGIANHSYYNNKKNQISPTFSYVLANADELVAYIDVPQNNPFEGRKVIVQNIFDKDLFYREYQFDFSRVDTPVTSASFSDDASVLKIKYLSGDDKAEITRDIQIK